MSITRLDLQNFRNVAASSMDFASGVNIFHGENGSGKTSIIEAIYFLSLGRSFRAPLINHLVCHDKDSFTLFAKINENDFVHQLGVFRSRLKEVENKLNGQKVAHSQIANILPILLINTDVFSVLQGGSKNRRQLMDWGTFYSDQQFILSWQKARHVLAQRNALLKGAADKSMLSHWDRQFLELAGHIDQSRQAYIEQFRPVFYEILEVFLPGFKDSIELQYYPGWSKKEGSLEVALQNGYARDCEKGYTHSGPQRADLRIKFNNIYVREVLSRGQQKLLICALKIAQGLLFYKSTGRRCVYLVDDVAAELDKKRCEVLLKELKKLDSQLFMTGIERDFLVQYFPQENLRIFGLNNGVITQED